MAWAATFDPFEALGLERDATPRAIKSKYHDLARRYHPNRHQGTDESKAALSEHFFHVNQAWKLLCEADTRRRCIELLELLDQQEAVLGSCADLFDHAEQSEQYPDRKGSSPAGHISSDADDDDEDLPRAVGVRRRQTFDEKVQKRSKSGLDGIAEGDDPSTAGASRGRQGRVRFNQLKSSGRSGKEDESSDNNTAAERRRRLDKLRRKEFEAFNKYRDAMVDKFEAEAAAEKHREHFEQAKWRRQYFERAPKETTQRVRLTQLMSTAIKALTAQKPARTRSKRGSIAGLPNSTLTPVEPSDTNQFLNLPSRTKTLHRRGYSSDISGDQTSSDENSSDKQTSPSRSPALPPRPAKKHRRLDSGPSLPLLPIPQHCLPNGRHDPISPVTGPGPKLMVRAPTTLGEMFDVQGSDVDSASASSRSPSPQTHRKGDADKFVMVPHQDASEIFGIEQDRRARSPSADRRSTSRNSLVLTSHSPISEACLFKIKQVGHLQYRHISMEHVHELTHTEKKWMLGVEPDTDMDPSELLSAVATLDENVANLFAVKPDIKELFNFRLIYSHRDVVKQQHQTFIALSYRRKLHVEKKQHKDHKYYTLPLEPEMFQAVWDERLSDTEGVWIDQICIDGDSEQERTISMSAMDMVYRSARLVVVALDDIELEAHEGSILESHMEEFDRQAHIPARKRFTRRQKPYLEAREDLYRVIRKMMRSSWFRRAWCRHEMRLAREHIFLVPCRTPGSWSGKSVLRFTSKCLTHFLSLATEVPFEPEIEAVKPALYAFFQDRSKLQEHDHRMLMHHGNFTTVVAEVFAMEAGGDPRIPEEQRAADARKDKISIILNTMECGLALHPKTRQTSISLPPHQCNYMLLLLALAARDPGALGSVGQPLRQLPYDLTSSWLFEPTNVDSGLNNYRTLNRLPTTSQITTHYQDGEHFVQLGLKFLRDDMAFRPRDSHENLALAEHFISVCDERNVGRNRKRYLMDNKVANRLFGSMRDVYIETLVCVFECGPDWMSDVCQRYGVSRWRHDLQPAYELLVALKNTSGRWPDSAWSNQATGFIMDFVNFMIIRGIPQRHITQPEKWRPVWVPTPGGGKLLTFSPSGDIRLVVPAALLDSDYIHLARLWVLSPRGERVVREEHAHHHREWTLLGKSILFSDDVASELLEGHSGIHVGQKVFGRGSKSSKALQIPHPRRG